MLRRPSLRASLTTVAAAVILVGGAGLASYAAGGSALGVGHGHAGGATTHAARAASEPKTLKFHFGSPGKVYHGNTTHLFSGKVPTGNYQIGMSGLVTEASGSGTDSYECLLIDKRELQRVLRGGTPDYTLWYALDGDGQGSFKYGVVNYSNNAQKIDRHQVAFGCLFSGAGTFTVQRTVTFTLRPVKVTSLSGSPISVPKSGSHHLSGLVR